MFVPFAEATLQAERSSISVIVVPITADTPTTGIHSSGYGILRI
jgi:hypothetical protein